MSKLRKGYWIAGLLALVALGLGAKAVFMAVAKQSREEEEEKRGRDDREQPEYLAISDSQIAVQKITFALPAPATLKKYLAFPGEIALNGERTVRISPRFAGMAKEVPARLGENVQKGQVLAVMESNESMSAYEIKAPMAGTLIGKNIKAGEMLKEEDTAFVLVDLGTVWVSLHVLPHDLPLVKPDKVLTLKDEEGKRGRAVITYVGPVAEAGTGTVAARALLDNAGGAWRPGLFVQAFLLSDSARVASAVPVEAVQSLNGGACVFIKTAKGIKPASVETGLSDEEKVEIRSGLNPRDTIVVGNAYLIKSEFEKGSFQEDEGGEDEEKDKDRE